MKIRIGIAGYGNLGRGVECAVHHAPDLELVALLTRRNPASIKTHTGVPVYRMSDAAKLRDQIDVMILCGGSANDLPEQTPELAQYFNVIDSFDTHAKIPEHFRRVDAACRKAHTIGIISVGWDPGMFSLNRVISQAILPNGKDYTFWGKGVSQGHSDAVRRIEGVKDARQYTIPVKLRLSGCAAGKTRRSPRGKSTRANALSLRKRVRIAPRLRKRFRPCRTILRIMIPPSISSVRKR